MDHQPVSRLRVRLRVLLRALHARLSRAARPDGLRAQDFRQADGGRGAGAHALAHADRHRRDSDRHGHGSLSASRAQVWADALDARSLRAAVGAGAVDHDQVEPCRSRPRAAQEDQSALEAVGELLGDNARSEAAAGPRAARAASGPAAARTVRAGAGGNPMQRSDDADDSGADGRSRGDRERGSRRTSRGRVGGVVAFAVSETRGGAPLHPVRQGAIPASGGANRHVLCARRVRSACV